MSLSPAPATPEHGRPGTPAEPGAFAAAWAGARRRWLVAGCVGLLFSACAAAAYYTQTPQKYTVTTLLQISPRSDILSDDHHSSSVKAEADYRKTQAAMVRSRPVVQKALETKKVADSSLLRGQADPTGYLETELKATALEGGQIRVALTGERPDELAAALNAVTAAYLTVVVDAEETQRRLRVDELDKVLALSEDRVRKQRNELRSLADTLGASDTQSIGIKQQITLQHHSALQSQLLGVEGQLRAARSKVEGEKAKLAGAKDQPIPEPLVDAALAADPAVKAAADESARAHAALEASKGMVQPGSPAHERLTAGAKTADEKLAKVKAQQQQTVVKALRDDIVRRATEALAEAQSSVSVLDHQRTALKAEADAARAEAEKIGRGSLELELKRTEIAEAEAIMRKLRAEKERLAIETQTYKRRVNVVVPADGATAKPAASAVAASAGLGVAGLAVGVLGVGYLESRRRRLLHSDDVAQVMKLRVLGNLPLVPGLDAGPLADVWGHQLGIGGSLLVEAVNDLRNMLLATVGGRTPQVIMVTSADQGEGKTTLACLLAQSLTQTGKRTLLVDADLRNPQVAARFGLPAAAGLGEVLRGEARPVGVLGGVPGTPLAVMTAGRPCSTIIRGLSVERIREVFAELRTQFDYVIVDSCPTPLADGMVVGACADAAVLVVRAGHSEESVVREACERMLAARVPLVGGVMNGLPLGRRWMRYPYAVLPPVQADEAQLPLAEPV